ncbi:unnamed protein product [Closterium sp. Naga37s-1]|nr:unnamed protein product [Closterium sp. Naga37s-1]
MGLRQAAFGEEGLQLACVGKSPTVGVVCVLILAFRRLSRARRRHELCRGSASVRRDEALAGQGREGKARRRAEAGWVAMGAGKRNAVTQEAFDALVREGMDEFDMAPGEAVEDAVRTLTMQGADLTGIVTAYSATGQRAEHPAAAAATQLAAALAGWKERQGGGEGEGAYSGADFHAVLHALCALSHALSPSVDGSQGGEAEQQGRREESATAAAGGSGPGEAAVVAGRNEGLPAAVGALGVVIGAVERGEKGGEGEEGEEGGGRVERAVCDALTCTEALLTHVPGARDHFFRLAGPPLLAAALPVPPFSSCSLTRVAAAARTVRAASVENEVIKEALMDAALHVALLNAIRGIVQFKRTADVDSSITDVAEAGSATCACCGAVRALLTNDDVRVAASKTFSNARSVAEAGAVDALLSAAAAFSSDVAVLPSVLPSVLAALKAIAVNEDICRSIAALSGVPLVLAHLRAALASHCSPLAAPSAALLAQLAGSDANKVLIVETGGIPVLVEAVKAFVDDGAVLQELLACLAAVTLRSPAHAAAAVAGGLLEAAVEAMEGRGATAGSQWQACQLLRNLAVRNPEHRPIMVEMGLEAVIRNVKSKHKSCRDVCSAALRDMGLDNYNQ